MTPKIEIWNVDPHLLHRYQRWIATEDKVIYAHSEALVTYVDNIDGELIGMTAGDLHRLGYTVELDHTC